MNIVFAGGITLALGVACYALFGDGLGGSNTSENYERGRFYEKCDTDYLQSASHLGFRASESECECFDDKLQKLTPSQQNSAYATLEDHLTLAFMGHAGAQVKGTNVTYDDEAFGQVDANVKIETSGETIIQQCSMF